MPFSVVTFMGLDFHVTAKAEKPKTLETANSNSLSNHNIVKHEQNGNRMAYDAPIPPWTTDITKQTKALHLEINKNNTRKRLSSLSLSNFSLSLVGFLGM